MHMKSSRFLHSAFYTERKRHVRTAVFCVDVQLIGLGMMACGSWFHASPDVHAYMTVFVNDALDSSLLAAAALLLVAGLILTLISVLAIVGIILNKPLFVFIVRACLHPLNHTDSVYRQQKIFKS